MARTYSIGFKTLHFKLLKFQCSNWFFHKINLGKFEHTKAKFSIILWKLAENTWKESGGKISAEWKDEICLHVFVIFCLDKIKVGMETGKVTSRDNFM